MKEIGQKLSFAGKLGSIIEGPFLGMLPPDWQIKIAGEESARYMSTTSRIINVGAGLYTFAFLGLKAFGTDIDPTSSNALAITGGILGIDSIVRESFYGIRYCLAGGAPFMRYTEPWGEPILSLLFSKK